MSTLKVGSIQPNSGTKVNITGSTLLITTASGHFSGSYSGDGSGLSGVAGFPFTGSGQVSGSLFVTGSDTLALRVSGSTALTGSLFMSGSITIVEGDSLTGTASIADLATTASHTAGTASIADLATTASHTAGTASFADYATSASYAISASHEITYETSSSLAETASFARTGDGIFSGSFSGSYQGDGSSLTGVGGFPHTGSADITGSLIVTGSAFVTSLTETSAERFKTNITTLDSQIENISLLKPVSFNWKEDNREDIGLIAEEINEIYPEFIGKNPNGEIQGVKYSKLTAVLVKSIQELNEKNKELELRIKQLEDK